VNIHHQQHLSYLKLRLMQAEACWAADMALELERFTHLQVKNGHTGAGADGWSYPPST
jgi:hypothetical protein